MRIARALLFGLALAGPAWLLATESGLRFAVACAERASGGALEVRGIGGRIIGDMQLSGLAIDTPGASVRIERMDLNLRLTHLLVARMQAEWLKVRGLTVIVHEQTAPAQHTPLAVRTPVYLAVEDGSISDFHLHLAGAAQDWVLPEAQFSARWRGRWIRIGALHAVTDEAGPIALNGRLSIADDLLRFEDFEITQPSKVTVNGSLALTDEAQNVLEIAWENLRWPQPDLLPWLDSPRGALRLEGPWKRYGWQLDAQAHGYDVPGHLVAHGHGNLHSLELAEAHLDALGGRVSGKGRLGWSPVLRTDLDLGWQNLNPVSLFADWAGTLNGDGRFEARWEAHRPFVEFDASFHDSQLRGYVFALQARGHTEQKSIFLQQLAVQSGASDLIATGQLWPRLGLNGELHSTDFSSLWAGLSGRGSVQFGAQGEPDAPRLSLKASVQTVGYGKYRAGEGSIDAALDPRGRSDLDVKLRDVELGIRLTGLTLTGGGTAEAHQLALAASGSEGTTAVTLQGGIRNGNWRGHLTQARVVPVARENAGAATPDEARVLEEPVALSLARGHFDAEPVCLGAADSRVCAQLGLAPGLQRLAFRIRNFDLRHLRPWLPGEWDVRGVLTGTAALRFQDGELKELRSDLEASAGRVDGGGVKMEFGPGRLQAQPDGGRLHVLWLLWPAGGEVKADIWVTPGADLLDRPMLGDLKVHMPDLSWLPVLSPEIAAAQGSLDAHLDVSGTPRGPSLDGSLQLAGGRLQLTTPGIELTGLTASFERGRNAPLLLHAQAMSGGGRIGVEGNLKTLQPKLAGELTVEGENVLGVNRPDIRAWLSPDLKLALRGRTAKLTGTLTVPRADITPQRFNRGGIAPSNDQVILEEEDAQAQGADRDLLIESEVKVVLGDNVRFDGLGLKTRLTGALTAFDEPGQATTGVGELRLDGGRYKAYGQDLQIETGRLIFNGGPVTNPAIDLTAVRKFGYEALREEQQTRVGLHARGTLAAPEFSLFSEPTMPQEEQLAWLVLGHPLSSSTDSTQHAQLSGAAAALGLSSGDYLAQQLAPKLGLDTVSIASKPGETTDLARFTIGKYLSPRLFVSYGVGLFQPGNFFRMQYDVNKHVKLVGETGLQQSGDVLYTIER